MEKQNMINLRELAKSYGIKGFKKYRKADLITQIENAIREYNDENSVVQIFPFSDDLFIKPKIRRKIPKEKCECGQYIYKSYMRQHLNNSKHHRKKIETFESDFVTIETTFKDRIYTLENLNINDDFDIPMYMDFIKNIAILKLNEALEKHKSVKVNLVLECSFKKIQSHMDHSFHLKNVEIFKGTNLDKFWRDQLEIITHRLDEFEGLGSGWTLNRVNSLRININKYTPLKGKSYIELPDVIKNKKAIINVKNEDNECFKWAILSALYPAQNHVERLSNYKKYQDKLDFTDINFPVQLKDIPKFEKQNNINVHVITADNIEKPEFYPIYSNRNEYEKQVDLFLFTKDTNSHYCWIKNLSKLICDQITHHEHKIYICRRCFYYTHDKNKLEDHENNGICKNNGICRIVLSKDKTLKFKNFTRKLKLPYAIYADFESILKPISSCVPSEKCICKSECKCKISFTNKYQRHIPSSFCIYVKSIYNNIKYPLYIYRGENAEKEFNKTITEIAKEIHDLLKINKEMVITSEEQIKHNRAKVCYICNGEFAEDKVYDHDHYTGEYRGAACNKCNVNFHSSRFIPVFFHNLTGYDCHMFVKELGYDKSNLQLIPNNEEKYMSFSKIVKIKQTEEEDETQPIKQITLRFLDSFKFMASSLDELSGNLANDQFKEIKKYYKEDIILRKGVFPYDYIDSFERYKENKLPKKEEFDNKLNESEISDKDYQHAQNIWNTYKCKNLGEYSDLYLKTDVLLLADIFENFRDICLKTYELDPCWYYTTPGLAWDAMLKYTNIELELLTDMDMILMIEKSIRGGISQCSHRYAKANNKYLDDYDKNKESNYLMYLDANNLYGHALSQPLPYKAFKWIENEKDMKPEKYGYFLEVNLEYPTKLHDAHNDLPLAPEKRKPPGSKISKLLLTLDDKKNYVVHYRTLQLYKDLGLKVTKIHKILQFKEKPFIKQYIELNTKLRSQATNDFEKDFFKLMNNAVFGKTMENIRNRQNIKLFTDYEKALKQINKVNFKSRTIFSENLMAIHLYKNKIVFDKPIYIGMAVLDLSKNVMFDFHYNIMKKKYPDIKLMYMDTDSFIYDIKTEDIYEDMKSMLDLLDTSEYHEDHMLHSTKNKKVIGKMKDELKGKIMKEFVGLRSKMYAYKIANKSKEIEVKKAKGIRKCVVQKGIKFQDYYTVIMNKSNIYRKQNVIRSYKHSVYSETVHKKALSFNDDKRYILEDGISTLAHGHRDCGI